MDENKVNSQNLDNGEFSEESDVQNIKSTKKSKIKGQDKKMMSEIQELNQKNEELKDKYVRIAAEYDNYRRRTAKEKIELGDHVKSSIILDFLPVVDDMDRAVQFLSEKTTDDLSADVINGVKLISNKLYEFLKSQGVEEINAKAMDFDIDLHEAITKFKVSDENMKDKVIDVVQKGYTLNGKVIRYAKVVVGE